MCIYTIMYIYILCVFLAIYLLIDSFTYLCLFIKWFLYWLIYLLTHSSLLYVFCHTLHTAEIKCETKQTELGSMWDIQTSAEELWATAVENGSKTTPLAEKRNYWTYCIWCVLRPGFLHNPYPSSLITGLWGMLGDTVNICKYYISNT